jgi:CRISPR/Cas system CSM-associated protein Csm5 (group 7 of RAMP superfamily)
LGILGTSNGTVLTAVQAQNDQQFKNVNNLLSLQDNHVEEFFQYHGKEFLSALEQLMEDVVNRVVSQLLSKLSFTTVGSNLNINNDTLQEFNKISQEKIELDLNSLLQSAINAEVVNQRKLAKQQYLESQGFGGGMPQPTAGMAIAGMTGQTQQYQQVQGAMNNGTGYPIPPTGTDGYGRPYWIDAQGQMSYEPPSSGLHLGAAIQKGAAWAKWLM